MSGISSGHLLSLAKVTRIESSWGLSTRQIFAVLRSSQLTHSEWSMVRSCKLAILPSLLCWLKQEHWFPYCKVRWAGFLIIEGLLLLLCLGYSTTSRLPGSKHSVGLFNSIFLEVQVHSSRGWRKHILCR